MKNRVVIAGVVLVLAIVGANFILTNETKHEPHAATQSAPNASVDADDAQPTETEVQLNETPEGSEPIVKLTAEQVSEIRQRSEKLASELDLLTKELAAALEDNEKSREIEAQYKKLAEEQNQLAIQLVRAQNQSLAAKE